MQKKIFEVAKEENYLCVSTTYYNTTMNIDEWLTQTFTLIDYNHNKEILSLKHNSILHIYLPAQSNEDEFLLKFSAKNLTLLWKLATVIDLDYGFIYPTDP